MTEVHPPPSHGDNGPEYASGALQLWAKNNDIQIAYIQLGNSQQNAYIERYNRTVRYDCVSEHLFESINDVQDFPRLGHGLTITNALTWALVALLQCKNRPAT